MPEFVGLPPNCKPECISNSECASNLACMNNKCKDPCSGSCGSNTECRVVSHTAMCVCLIGYEGDPFIQCTLKQSKTFYRYFEDKLILVLNSDIYFFRILADIQPTVSTPCTPSPCGSNAICKEQGGVGSCSCLPDYIGNPYEGCRPECIMNSDCVSTRACIHSKCQDSCPGACGMNAECQVVNHLPQCNCFPGYTGQPYQFCQLITTQLGKQILRLICFDLFF